MHSLYSDANFSSSLVCGVQQIPIVSWVAIASVTSLKVKRTGVFLVLSVDRKIGPSINVSHAKMGRSARFA